MGVRVISAHMGAVAVMYCSTTEWAFGPVFGDTDEHSAEERIEMFLEWLAVDPRALPESVLERKYSEWREVEAVLWARKEVEEDESLDEEEKKEHNDIINIFNPGVD